MTEYTIYAVKKGYATITTHTANESLARKIINRHVREGYRVTVTGDLPQYPSKS